jgi:hypothetical protein
VDGPYGDRERLSSVGIIQLAFAVVAVVAVVLTVAGAPSCSDAADPGSLTVAAVLIGAAVATAVQVDRSLGIMRPPRCDAVYM